MIIWDNAYIMDLSSTQQILKTCYLSKALTRKTRMKRYMSICSIYMWEQGAWKEGQKEDKWAFLKKLGKKKESGKMTKVG